MSFSVSIKNGKALARSLKRYPRIAPKHVNQALTKAALLLERKSKQEIERLGAVDKGTLKSSIQHKPARGSVATVEAVADYAVPVHEGHREFVWGRPTGRRRRPRPFMDNALDKSKADIDKVFGQAVDKIMREATRVS